MDMTTCTQSLYTAPERSEMLMFNIGHRAAHFGPRVGELLVHGRHCISTPSIVVPTSRGAIPHVTQDLVQKHTTISVTYAGLEDFLEKSRNNAPILHTPPELSVDGSVLRAYTSLPNRCLSILGARRVPRVDTPHQNTNNALAISTSFGFASLDVEDYNRATQNLTPDISTTAVDLVQADKISRKRIEKSADRTHAWLRDTLAEVERIKTDTPIFASIPPLEPEQQSFYLSDLKDDFQHHLSGVCIYDPASASVVPESLDWLPVLCISNPYGPHDLLKAVSLGIDMITTPFVTTASEAGLALTFDFSPLPDATNEPLGVDMWDPSHATDLSPLSPSCSCYACTRHHRAYLHHLLQAKEMLAWTLLQIHNFHIVNRFMQHVRESISSNTFEQDSERFRAVYDAELPSKTGQGPRIRGYQIRSVGRGESKKNSKAYNKLDEQARKIEEAESGVAMPLPGEDTDMLESQGLGQKLE